MVFVFKTFLENWLIPSVEILVIIGIIGFITIVIFRALYIKWNRIWRFKLQYGLFKGKVDPIKSEWIIEAIGKGLHRDKIRMKLLLAGFKGEDVYEMMYLYDKFYKQMKGGLYDGRRTESRKYKGYTKKDGTEQEFPNTNSN